MNIPAAVIDPILAIQSRRESLRTALSGIQRNDFNGVAVGALADTRLGAQSSMPTRAEVTAELATAPV